MREEDFELERYIGEHIAQVKNRGAGETRRTSLPDSEHERSLVNRFERGQILHAYTVLREQIRAAKDQGLDASHQKEFLQRFRKHAYHNEKNLDELNREYYEKGFEVEVEGPDIGRHVVPLVELDLQKPKEGEEDLRVPYFVIGGIASNYHQTAALSMALALEGNRVFSMTYPEQGMAQHPPDWGSRVRSDGTPKLHAQLVKKTIEKLGLERVNLVGYSIGGMIAIEAASDRNFHSRLQDLVAIEAVGFQDKGRLQMALDLFYSQGSRTVRDPEQRLKLLEQGFETSRIDPVLFLSLGDVARRQQFTQEKLMRVQPQGRFQVFVGSESPVADAEMTRTTLLAAEGLRRAENPNASPVEIYRIQGGDHGIVKYAMGIVTTHEAEQKPAGQVITLEASELENSAAAAILEDLKAEDLAA